MYGHCQQFVQRFVTVCTVCTVMAIGMQEIARRQARRAFSSNTGDANRCHARDSASRGSTSFLSNNSTGFERGALVALLGTGDLQRRIDRSTTVCAVRHVRPSIIQKSLKTHHYNTVLQNRFFVSGSCLSLGRVLAVTVQTVQTVTNRCTNC